MQPEQAKGVEQYTSRGQDAVKVALGLGCKEIKKRISALQETYSSYIQPIHKELAAYICVGSGRFSNQEPYKELKNASGLLNPTAVRARAIAGAGLHGGLSSPAKPWFQLKLADPDANKHYRFRNWLDDVERVLYRVFKESNLYHWIHADYEDVLGFGNGCGFIADHPERILHVHPVTAGQYALSVHEGLPHTWVREFMMPAVNYAKMFGYDRCPERVKNQIEQNPYKFMPLYHIVEPNYFAEPGKLGPQGMPWRSIYLYKNQRNDEGPIAVQGFKSQRVICPRFFALGNEAYGWGPGLWALGLSKGLQAYEADSMDLAHKLGNPPMGAPVSFRDRSVDITAAAINVMSQQDYQNKAQLYPLFEVNPTGIAAIDTKIQRIEVVVGQLFYNDLFMMLTSDKIGEMTATEVLKREEEKVILLGPTIERQIFERLDPLIKTAIQICSEPRPGYPQGILPPPPPDMMGQMMAIEYISVLAQAQKIIMARSMESMLGVAERVIGVDEIAARYSVNWPAWMTEYSDLVGLTEKVMNPQEEVQRTRQALEQQQMQAAQIADQLQGAQAAKTLSETKMDQNSALDKVAEQMT